MGVMGALALWHVLVHLTAISDIRHLIKTSINDDVTPFNLVGDEAYIPQRREKRNLKRSLLQLPIGSARSRSRSSKGADSLALSSRRRVFLMHTPSFF